MRASASLNRRLANDKGRGNKIKKQPKNIIKKSETATMTKYCNVINGTTTNTYNRLPYNNRRLTKEEAAAPSLDRPLRVTITLHNNIIVVFSSE